MKPVYRVYEAQVLGEDTVSLVAVSALREISLREEIAWGKLLMKLGRLVAEVDSRNKAREMADCEV
ncbi:hypothetical protein GFC01_10995 [Desulfofundulus thermobenzoicus]|uniref:Uncharacterized protein n=1 Tax=Desulfofundulus thermobenzoicus TaxID=29376 RepID=A0A6N7IUI5_9FIRM|nr:hypothetical protein [Desulfofundulus thermobenzoicus]MQL52778.1 hypothetical protein [Desulfofundulus thermobenzoicus]